MHILMIGPKPMRIRAGSGDRRTLQRYLRGELPDTARAQVEELLFNNDSCFARLCQLEVEMIDGYVRGHMPARQARLFEARFLQSRRGRNAVAFARVLLECAGYPGVIR
jgi:anti-sigma factor RsiW